MEWCTLLIPVGIFFFFFSWPFSSDEPEFTGSYEMVAQRIWPVAGFSIVTKGCTKGHPDSKRLTPVRQNREKKCFKDA